MSPSPLCDGIGGRELKHCKLQYEINLFVSDCLLVPPGDHGPRLPPDRLRIASRLPPDTKMVFGHNLHLMAPFEFLEAGFCMEFRRASFWFLCTRADFWTTGPICGPPDFSRSTFWPGDLFGPKMGSRKTYFCDGIDFSWGFRGFPVTQMNCMVPRTHLGVLLCQKPWFFSYF